MVLHGYSGNSFGGLPSAIGASIYANGHQLRSGIALGHDEFVLQNKGLFDPPPPGPGRGPLAPLSVPGLTASRSMAQLDKKQVRSRWVSWAESRRE